MNVGRFRDALVIGRPVWVEIWNGEVIWDIYTPGKWLVAGEDAHHRLMLDPVPGDPVVHIKAAGAKGKFTGLSTVAENRGLTHLRQRGRSGKAYCILLEDDVHFELPLQPFKDEFKTQILASKNNALHYPFAKNGSLAERGYLKRATSGLISLFISALTDAPTFLETDYPKSDAQRDIDDIKERHNIPTTTKQALIAARLGQEDFEKH